MSQKATSRPTADLLSPNKIAALEGLLAGGTVTEAAKAAGVARETVHRWKRQDWPFRATLNRGRRELYEAVQSRLLASATTAASNLASAVEEGNLKASFALLKGLGALSGCPPAIGSEDLETLRGDAHVAEQEAQLDRLMRPWSAAFRGSPTGDPME